MIRPLRRNPRDSQCNLLIHRVCELADDCRKWKLPAPSAKRRAWNTNRENLFRDSVFRLMMEINCGKTSRVHVTLELLDGNRRWKIFSLAAHFVIVNLYRHDVAHGGERSMKEGKRRADMPTSRVAQFFDNSNHDRHNSAWPISYFLRVPWNFPSRPNNSDFVTELASHSTECRRVARLRARKTRTLSDTLSLIIWGWRASQTWSALKNNENRARVRMRHLNSILS